MPIVRGSTAASTAASLDDSVAAAYAAWDAAFNAGDAKAVAAFYVEDAVFLPASHEVVKGPAAIEGFFSGLFKAGMTAHHLDLIKAYGDDEMAMAAAKWSAKGGDGSAHSGIATHGFAIGSDGSLKLRLHTFN